MPATCRRSNTLPSDPSHLFRTPGKLDREVLLPLVLRYLASIPATPLPPPKTLPEVKPLPVVYPDAPIVEDVKVRTSREGQEQLSRRQAISEDGAGLA